MVGRGLFAFVVVALPCAADAQTTVPHLEVVLSPDDAVANPASVTTSVSPMSCDERIDETPGRLVPRPRWVPAHWHRDAVAEDGRLFVCAYDPRGGSIGVDIAGSPAAAAPLLHAIDAAIREPAAAAPKPPRAPVPNAEQMRAGVDLLSSAGGAGASVFVGAPMRLVDRGDVSGFYDGDVELGGAQLYVPPPSWWGPRRDGGGIFGRAELDAGIAARLGVIDVGWSIGAALDAVYAAPDGLDKQLATTGYWAIGPVARVHVTDAAAIELQVRRLDDLSGTRYRGAAGVVFSARRAAVAFDAFTEEIADVTMTGVSFGVGLGR